MPHPSNLQRAQWKYRHKLGEIARIQGLAVYWRSQRIINERTKALIDADCKQKRRDIVDEFVQEQERSYREKHKTAQELEDDEIPF